MTTERLSTIILEPSKISPENVEHRDHNNVESDVEFNLKINQITDEIYKQKEPVILDWMREIIRFPLTTDACLHEKNIPKNRFQNILLYDINRVRINDANRGNDYYHASFVDGYDKQNRYILAQAPFDEDTEYDFWRMVVTMSPSMIVLLAATMDGDKGTAYIPQFWNVKKERKSYGEIVVKTINVAHSKNWDVYSLELSDKQNTKGVKNPVINLLHYKKWISDNKVPEYILDFRAFYTLKKAETEVKKIDGPIMIVCPTGTHRAAFFAAMDIIMDRINQEKRVGVKSTVQIVTKQRYGSFVFFEHYCNLVETIIKHCMASNIVDLHMLAEAELKRSNTNNKKE
uniref:Protein-tyrosine phosphatase n=1 Tax=Strongyloides venezuelensis TaxID=75913 RepID=A0A0K0F009_STRVS